MICWRRRRRRKTGNGGSERLLRDFTSGNQKLFIFMLSQSRRDAEMTDLIFQYFSLRLCDSA